MFIETIQSRVNEMLKGSNEQVFLLAFQALRDEEIKDIHNNVGKSKINSMRPCSSRYVRTDYSTALSEYVMYKRKYLIAKSEGSDYQDYYYECYIKSKQHVKSLKKKYIGSVLSEVDEHSALKKGLVKMYITDNMRINSDGGLMD